MKLYTMLLLFALVANLFIFSTSQAQFPEKTYHALKTDTPPQIDAEMDSIWVYTFEAKDLSIQSQPPPGSHTGYWDFTPSFRILWDESYIYFYIEVVDDILNADVNDIFGEENTGWNDDVTEIFIDGDLSQNEEYDGLNDGQLLVVYGFQQAGYFSESNMVDAFDSEAIPVATADMMDDEGNPIGYIVEAAVPVDMFEIDASPGSEFGLDVKFGDDDMNDVHDWTGEDDANDREDEMRWNSTGADIHNPGGWGICHLLEDTVSDGVLVKETDKQIVIDGIKENAWHSMPTYSNNFYVYNTVPDDGPVDADDQLFKTPYDDCRIEMSMLWDVDYLYFFVEIYDEYLLKDGAGDHDDDSFEIYLDGGLERADDYDENDFGYRFSYNPDIDGFDIPTVIWKGQDYTAEVETASQLIYRKTAEEGKWIESDVVIGRTLEFQLPIYVHDIWDLFGIEVSYNDDDDGEERDHKLEAFTGTDDAWSNMRNVAKGYLVEGTSSSVESKESLPTTVLLSQNYPNPFNPVTEIQYSLQNSGQVKLVVYDLLGHEVSELVNENQTPGAYKVRFDGATLPSGLYFYELELDNQSIVRKMMLTK